MDSFTDQEYLALVQKLTDQQYGSALEDYDIEEMEWIPDEPEVKRNFRPNHNGRIDLTDTKSTLIKEELFKCTNIKVGDFRVQVDRYNEVPSQDGFQTTLDLSLWEPYFKTPSGIPCYVEYRVNIEKDSRFKDRPWIKYFVSNSTIHAEDVPVDTVVEIVRWLQALKRMSAFI